ncbi:iron transporter [Klebsiella pneumoniae]|nr:iron transporter [Klebsiella pneumoniae]
MASLMEVRDMLALQGRMEAKQLSARLQTPQPLIDAMLERMEAMGKVVRISETSEGCLSGSCKSCPEAGRSGGRCDERSQAWSRNEVKRVRQL